MIAEAPEAVAEREDVRWPLARERPNPLSAKENSVAVSPACRVHKLRRCRLGRASRAYSLDHCFLWRRAAGDSPSFAPGSSGIERAGIRARSWGRVGPQGGKAPVRTPCTSFPACRDIIRPEDANGATVGRDIRLLTGMDWRDRMALWISRIAARVVRYDPAKPGKTSMTCTIEQVGCHTTVAFTVLLGGKEGTPMFRAKFAPVIEPAVIADVFASGILVEAREDIVRLTYYVEQHSWATEGEERVVVAKIVMARATVVE